MKRVLVIDNYDSFTYNLVHALEEILAHDVDVKRNDALNFDEVEHYNYLVLSPGPGLPDEAGDLKRAIATFSSSKHILGVCLGHQAIGEVFGASLQNLSEVYHGVQTSMFKTESACPLLEGLDDEFVGGRYHSWVIKKDTLPAEFEVTCQDAAGQIMAIRHQTKSVFGVQFHPESVLTPEGHLILSNFLNLKQHEAYSESTL